MEASGNMAAARAGRLLLLGTVLVALAAGAWGVLQRRDEVRDLAAVRDSIPAPRQKIVLIGLDGADWQVARPLMEQGRLPVLSALVAGGASGELTSIPPMISPALWTTVVTGVGRERHGIHDFVYKERGT